MTISYPDTYFQTALFLTVFITFAILTTKRKENSHPMNHPLSYELKGIAILMVLFSHIGYFLFSDHTILYPLSVAGGVGVNIFLFLSGFGLSTSENNSHKSVLEFYKVRLRGIFVPMWLVLLPLLILDYFILNRTYSLVTVLQNILGFFSSSDIDASINSPLWYFTLILFYYLIFPLVYRRGRPILSAAIILLLGYFVVSLNLPVTEDLLKLYKLHLIAFPLGIIFAYIFNSDHVLKLKNKLQILRIGSSTRTALRFVLIFLLLIIFGYTAIHSGVGEKISSEALLSMLTTVSLIFIIMLMKVRSGLVIILGKYSYEVYLLQWPIMYRYDFIYKYTPTFLGTLLYLIVFVLIGYLMKAIVNTVFKASS